MASGSTSFPSTRSFEQNQPCHYQQTTHEVLQRSETTISNVVVRQIAKDNGLSTCLNGWGYKTMYTPDSQVVYLVHLQQEAACHI